MAGYLFDPTLNLQPFGQPIQPQQPKQPGEMTDAEFLAQQLMDPSEFQRRFGGNPDSSALERESIARRMALAQQLQAAPVTGAEGPGASGASGALGGLRHSLQVLRGVGLQNDALSRESALKGQTKNDEYGKTRLKLAMEALDAQRRAREQQGKADSEKGQKDTELTTKLREELLSNPVTKDTQQIAAAVQRVREAHSQPSAAGDIALVYGFMKAMDPGSTVREGEFATAENAGGIPSQLANLYNKVLKGERLPQAVRDDFLRQSEGLLAGQVKRFQPLAQQYTSLSQRLGLDPANVVLDFGFKANPGAAPGALNPDQERVIKGKRYRKNASGMWEVEE